MSLLSAAEVAYLDARYAPAAAMDAHWLLYCGVLVFLMQAGFAMLCAGSIRAKNAQNILMKNLMDICVGAAAFWGTGYAVAYGARGRGHWFAGTRYFFLSEGFMGEDAFHSWFFQFAFSATSATIVSGAVAERCAMPAYACYSALLAGFVWPVVAHWAWSKDGWLSYLLHSPLAGVGVVDFAGSGVVHMVGGAAAGIGAKVLGPRIGRFGPKGREIKGHSVPLVVLGTFLLWVGWYGFNPGSTLAISGEGVAEVAAKTAATTTLAAAAGGLSNLFIHHHLGGFYDVAEMCNGVLAGLVSITSACSVVEPWAAVVIGVVGACAYTCGSRLLVKLEIDDAVNATPVHFFAGAWGLFAPAFFARPYNMRNAYGNSKRAGLFYGGGGEMLACQTVGFVAITAWVTVTMFPFFTLMNKLGVFRVSPEVEEIGCDDSKHGGSAYSLGALPAIDLEKIEKQIEGEMNA